MTAPQVRSGTSRAASRRSNAVGAPPAPGGATARALLNLEADSGSITVDGRVDVRAQAFDDGGEGAAIASALTNTIAGAGEGVTGGVTGALTAGTFTRVRHTSYGSQPGR